MGQFTFRFFFSYFLLLEILVFQAVAEGSTTTSTDLSVAYPRKMMLHRVLLSTTSTKSYIADPPEKSNTEGENEGEKLASIGEAPESTIEREHHHSDKSVAGGGVIIGGLVTAIFAVVYCYIRVTRKRDGDH